MRKLLIVLALSLIAFSAASAYYGNSAFKDSTAGVMYNEFDNIADGLYIFDVTNNVLGLGSRTMAAWLNPAASYNWTAYFGLTKGLPMNLRVSAALRNQESAGDVAPATTITSIAVTGNPVVTTNTVATSWFLNNLDSSYRDQTVIVALPLGAMPFSVRYNYAQFNNKNVATYAIGNNVLGAASTSTIGYFYTNTATNATDITRDYTIYAQGYNDSVAVTNTISPNVKLGSMYVYIPVQFGAAGNNQYAVESNYQTTNNTVTNFLNVETFNKNGKETFFGVKPSVRMDLANVAKGLAIDATVGAWYGVKDPFASLYTRSNDVTQPVLNGTNGSNTTIASYQNNYGHMTLSAGSSIWYYLSQGKLNILVNPGVTVGLENTGYVSMTSNESVVTVDRTNASKTQVYANTTLGTSATTYGFKLPIGIEYAIWDWLSVRSGAVYNYSLSSTTTTATTGTNFNVSYTTTGAAVATNVVVTYSLPSTSTTTAAASSMKLNFGIGLKLADGVFIDANLTSAIAAGSLLSGNGYFLLGSWVENFTSTVNWTVEARYLF